MANIPTTKSRHSSHVLAGLVLVAACLYVARQVLIPVALAVLLSFVLTPAVSALQRRGLGRLFSVLLVVGFALLLLGGIGYVISRQINNLIVHLPSYKGEIVRKMQVLPGGGDGDFFGRIQELFNEASRQIVSEVAWPAAEGLGSAFLVVVLVVFMLTQRENLRNRIVRLVGHGRLIVTTRALDEAARRISRYLLMQVCINAGFGMALAAGLWLAGLLSGQRVLCQYALLWGFLAGSLRFVPYLGTWVAAALVVGFSVATVAGWALPLGIFAFFLVLELLTANVVEPLLFGHSTGISPLALLLAAAFWTWLWGPVGLVLSTPLTVILVVLGKYVPQLEFLEVLLGDEPALSTDVTFYQRLVARDLDEASDLIDEYSQGHSPEEVCEQVLLPALLLARRDRERDELDADNYQFALQSMRDVLEDLASVQPSPSLGEDGDAPPRIVVLGCPGRDEADELALDVFALLLRQSGYAMEVISAKMLSAEVLARVGSSCPAVVCIGSLPPGGLAQARYLCKRIRQQCPDGKVVVGRWGERENMERVQKRLRDAGADHVGTTLQESRAHIVPLLQAAHHDDRGESKPPPETDALPKLVHSR